MMPALSFSVVEILPALLNRTKTQTIRPAWRDWCSCNHSYTESGGYKGLHTCYDCNKPFRYGPKGEYSLKPRYKVGDIVKIYWKQRTSPKNSWFCSGCGNIVSRIVKHGDTILCENPQGIFPRKPFVPVFPKLMGEVEITDVFEIIMRNDSEIRLMILNANGTLNDAQEIWKRDGFESPRLMSNWFDKKYDLSSPKKFAVYRWKWK